MAFGQLVIGPPGSGKTTYCTGLAEFMRALGRPVALVNLDPANETLPYEPAVDIGDLVCLDAVMDAHGLGPNGGLVYCIEYLAEHLDWLHARLAALAPDVYLLFDCPGQVELYTHNSGMRRLVDALTKTWRLRLVAAHLVDSHYCAEPVKYLSALVVSLSTMVQLELPHVNVLSKVDLVESGGRLPFALDFYLRAERLEMLVDMAPAGASSLERRRHRQRRQRRRQREPGQSSQQPIGSAPTSPSASADASDEDSRSSNDSSDLVDPEWELTRPDAGHESGEPPVSATPAADALARRFSALSRALGELVESYALVRFVPLAIEDRESVAALLAVLDKANGYLYAGLQGPDLLGAAYRDLRTDREAGGALAERYMSERPVERDIQAVARRHGLVMKPGGGAGSAADELGALL